jgi:hypothetical protein
VAARHHPAFAWLQLPVLALVGLFFTVSLMSGISTVAGAEAMSAVTPRSPVPRPR